MHRLGLVLGVVALMSAAPVFAAEVTAVIKEINTITRVVTLADGKAYSTKGNIDLAKVKAGDRVKITFDPIDPASVFAIAFPGLTGSATTIAIAAAN